MQALDQLVTDGIQTLFSSTLTLIGTAAILVALDPGLALVTFLTFPVLFVGSLYGLYFTPLFDFLMGINRWIYRTLLYVTLLSDEYPPFRLDAGPTEPTDPTENRKADR